MFVRQHFSPFGGGELMLDRLIRALIGRGTDVTIITRSWPKKSDGLNVILCDPRRVTRSLREPLFARAACKVVGGQTGALVQAHERIPCCDIYRAGEGVHAANLEWRGRRISKAARIATRALPFHRSMLHLERRLFGSPRLKAVVANSSMVAEEIVRYYGFPRERIHLVPNGIDLSRYSLDARERHRDDMRRQFSISDDQLVALVVGSGYARKGLRQAVDALARSHGDAELWVVGHDSRPKDFAAHAERRGVGSRLRIFGPQADLLPYYGAADILLLPSIYDPFPSAVIEALACGLPVVASTGSGGREAAGRLDPKLVCDISDVDAVVASIERAFELSSQPSTALAAREIAEEYGIDRMVDRMLDLYSVLPLDAGESV